MYGGAVLDQREVVGAAADWDADADPRFFDVSPTVS